MPWFDPAWLNHADTTGLLGHTPFGEHPETGDLFLVLDKDREMHTYIVGQTGYGKSGLVENLAYHDILKADKAVVVFDFHGDLANRIMAALPDAQMPRVFLFDMLDESHPLGLDLFTRDNLTSTAAVNQAVNRILHVFEALWPETKSHAHLPNFLRSAVLTLLANDNTSLYDMYRMFNDPAYRQQLLTKAPEDVKAYWRQFDALTVSAKEERSQAIVNRLHALFMGNPLMQNVLGQAPGRIHFDQIIEDKHVIVIKLPGRTMTYEARLVAGILLAQLQAAVFAGDGNPVAVYLDEFQQFATPDLPILLTEGRKYRISIHLSHQIRSQLPKDLQDATLGANTIVCFRPMLDDSRELAPLFTTGGTYIKPEHVERHACQRLLDDGSPEPIVQAFVDYYLRPLNGYRRGARIEIRNRGFSMRDEVAGPFKALFGYQMPEPGSVLMRLDDPVPWLDDLFRRVMETKGPNLPIPKYAVEGFANTGVGFWPQVRGKGDSDPVFQPGYQFPDTILDKDPMNGTEQLLHCVAALRLVMEYLAVNPIGKETKATDHDTAQILRTLPKRAACIRSGDDLGQIYTLPNPEHVSKQELEDRLIAIRYQTRAEYCRTREEVEAMRAARKAQPKQPTQRWEQR